MIKIFISYRREDSSDAASRITDQLEDEFGRGSVFLDVDDIPFGEDFRSAFDREIRESDVVLALIGPEWLSAADNAGQLKIHNQDDFVRRQLASAIKHGKYVVPVLIGDASLPTSKDLPNEIEQLTYLNAAIVRSGADFDSDVRRLSYLIGQRSARPSLWMRLMQQMRRFFSAIVDTFDGKRADRTVANPVSGMQELEDIARRFARLARGELARIESREQLTIATVELPSEFVLQVSEIMLMLPRYDFSVAKIGEVTSTIPGVAHTVAVIASKDRGVREAFKRKAEVARRNWAVVELDELQELSNASDSSLALANVLAEQIELRHISPYHIANAVPRDAVFFGRKDLLNRVSGREPTNYLLAGGRQVGKSSFLLALQRQMASNRAVDCRYLSIDRRDLRLELARELVLDDSATWDQVFRALRSPPSQSDFWMFLLDEMDYFVTKDATSEYRILSEFRNLASEGSCFFILTGFWRLYQASVLDFHSPIRNFGELLEVGALEYDACRQLVTVPMQYVNLSFETPDLITRIIDQTGQRANLISIVCHSLVGSMDRGRHTITENDVSKALASDDLHSSLEGWRALAGKDDEANRLDRVIVYSTVESGRFTEAQLIDILETTEMPFTVEKMRESLTRLRLAFILKRVNEGYEYPVPIFVEYRLREEPQVQLRRETKEARAHL